MKGHCKYCGITRKNSHSLAGHSHWCLKNPSRELHVMKLSETNTLKRKSIVKICKRLDCSKKFEVIRKISKNGKVRKSSFEKRFCSLQCANTRHITDDMKRRISETQKGKVATYSAREKQRHTWIKRREILEMNKALLPFDSIKDWLYRKQRLFKEQLGKCETCNLSEWLGKKITLEIEHKDGHRWNNKRENVCLLCPNCHSQTPTWRRSKSSLKRKGIIK